MTNFIDDIRNSLSDTKEAQDKISDQHILMLKLKEIAQISRMADTAPIFRAAPGNVPNETVEDKTRRFNHLAVLDYEHPYAISNILMNQENEDGTMLRLSTLQLSMLLPRIRIFKIVYSNRLEKEIEIELPFEDVASKDDIEKIFSTGVGRGNGVGIKGFEWKSMAKNEANLAQFSATLSLFIQNIEEMNEIRNSTNVNGEDITVSVLDLLYQKPKLRSGFNEGSNVYDPKYFGIKVEVGWFLDPTNENNKEVFKNESAKYGDNPDKVFDIIQKQKQIFYLTLVTHNFQFNEDGSIELTIDYIASSEIEASDHIRANVLRLSDDAERELKNASDRLKNANRVLNLAELSSNKTGQSAPTIEPTRRIGIAKGSDGDIPYTDPVLAERANLKKERDEAASDLEKLKKNQKIERMKSIVNGLIKRNLVNSMFLPLDDYKNLSNLRSAIIDDNESLIFLNQQLQAAKNNVKIVPLNSLNWDGNQTILNTNESGETSGVSVTESSNISSLSKNSKNPKDTTIQISFFLLGDLFDTVLKHIFNDDYTQPDAANFTTKTNRVMLGPITYYDFGSIEDSGLIMRLKGTKNEAGELVSVLRGKQTTLNLADIPISVNEFNKWFVDHIVNKDLAVFSFLDFSKALIDDLVISALASDGFKFAPKQQLRVNMLPFSAPQNENEDVFQEILNSGNTPTKSFRFNLNASQVGGVAGLLKSFINLNSGGKKQNYILFYGANQPPFDRVADEKTDLQEKIFHIYIGEERGIVKKVNFNRDDNPRLRVNNIQLNNPEKQQDGMIIREKYSGTFDFFGNFLFSPGQQMFVHPTYPGLKGRNVRENIFKNLGLGGYYFVVEVTNRINSGEFTTTVRTKWNSFGDSTLNVGDQLEGKIVEQESLATGQSNRVVIIPG